MKENIKAKRKIRRKEIEETKALSKKLRQFSSLIKYLIETTHLEDHVRYEKKRRTTLFEIKKHIGGDFDRIKQIAHMFRKYIMSYFLIACI